MELAKQYKKETNGRAYKIKENPFSFSQIPTIRYAKWLEKKVSQLEKLVSLRGAENGRNEIEFKIAEREYERGMIKGWEHIQQILITCIKAHKEELKEENIDRRWEFNKHRYESDESN